MSSLNYIHGRRKCWRITWHDGYTRSKSFEFLEDAEQFCETITESEKDTYRGSKETLGQYLSEPIQDRILQSCLEPAKYLIRDRSPLQGTRFLKLMEESE